MIFPEHYYEFRRRVDCILTMKYDIPQGNTPYIKEANLTQIPLAFYNGCNMFLDLSSLPPFCVSVTDLSNKNVLYGIFCNEKFYIGQTTDFGERMSTHVKDSKKHKKQQKLYADMKMCKECCVFILGVFDGPNGVEEMKNAETEIIQCCKNFSIEKECGYDKRQIKFIKESIEDEKEYSLKYCYNISN